MRTLATRCLLSAVLSFSAACARPPQSAREAAAYLDDGNLHAAEGKIEEGLQAHPRDPYLWRLKIRLLSTRGDARGAVAAYEQWKQLNGGPDDQALRQLAFSTLWHALRNDAPEVRTQAIRAAWALDAEPLAEPVARTLDDDDEVVRATAAAALLRSHPDAHIVLRAALDSPEADARIVAIDVLGEKVGLAAIDDIRAGLSDSDGRVRATACTALARIGAPAEDAATLVNLAERDPDGLVRAAALRALVKLGPGAAVRVATARLGDDFLGARLAAVAVLGAAHDQAGLATALRSSDPFVALRAAVALKKAEATTGALASADWTVRVAAINALEELGHGKDAGRLLADGAWQVKMAAARALHEAGAPDQAVAVLIELAAGPADQALEAAIDLRRFGDARSAPVFTGLLAEQDPLVRARAVAALRGKGDLPDGVVALLGDAAWPVRVAAAWTLLAHLHV